MATDERFGYYPYAGVGPSGQMVFSSGLEAVFGNYKVASGVTSNSITPTTIYYANVNGSCYAIAEYSSSGPNTIYSAPPNSPSANAQNINSLYTITGTSIRCYYYNLGSSASSFIPKGAFDLPAFNNLEEAVLAFLSLFPDDYVNLQYVGNGCLVNGIPYVASGTGVLAAVTLPIGTTLSADNISVTKNGTPIDFNYNPQTQQIAFTAI